MFCNSSRCTFNTSIGAYTSIGVLHYVKINLLQNISSKVLYLDQVAEQSAEYRGTSLIRNTPLLGPYSGPITRVVWWSYGGGAGSYERGTPVQQEDAPPSKAWIEVLNVSFSLQGYLAHKKTLTPLGPP